MTQSLIHARNTARLIPSQYSEDGDSVLARIADDQTHLDLIFALDHATNDRLLSENDLLPGIGRDELVFGVPFYRIINAAFCHPHPLGSRFNGPDRGCWYAADTIDTAMAEVIFHKTIALAEVNRFDDSASYDCYLSDITGDFRILTDKPADQDYLNPDDYSAAQTLAEALLDQGVSGVQYPSVRQKDGTCYACFRPALVTHVRRDVQVQLVWTGQTAPTVTIN